MKRYVVLIYPPVTAKPDLARTYAQSGYSGPVVKRVTSRDAENAAALGDVKPGGHALVFEESDGKRFDRAAMAPLLERRMDGNPLGLAA